MTRAEGTPERTSEEGLLGSVSGVQVRVALNSRPWELAIDTLVISVSPVGFGQLGNAVQRKFPSLNLGSVDLTRVTPDRPETLELPPQGSLQLRRIILATARHTDASMPEVREGPATLEAVHRATTSSIRLADARKAKALGLPLLGAGAIGLAPNEVAYEVIPATRTALREQQSHSLEEVILLCKDEPAKRGHGARLGLSRSIGGSM